jgi:hypothetical protein
LSSGGQVVVKWWSSGGQVVVKWWSSGGQVVTDMVEGQSQHNIQQCFYTFYIVQLLLNC